ncbi:Olfactory receptor, partial [Pristimantis euphronides]
MFLFCLFLVVYCGTIGGNLLIITLVSTSQILHTPMYFFISQLSINDILLTTDIAPNMLHFLLNNGGTITFVGCISQFYFFSTSEASECFLLTVMSYDRYVAICNPLRYTSMMTTECCVSLSVTCWLVGFSIIFIDIFTISELNFCKPNIIDHFYCDLLPLQEISCSDIFNLQLEIYFLSIISVIIPTIIIIACYTNIIVAILRIPSSTGRHKAFSTCSSHLIVVSIFYWTMFSVYVFPTKVDTLNISKILSLLYTVITPLANPIIYSLRNKDIWKAINETIKNIKLDNNLTMVTEFFLLGFQVNQSLRFILFSLLLVVYCGTICGNLLIITLVSTSKNLHTPMYFFISQLAISDLLLTTDIVPNLLHILLNNGGTITFVGCIIQLYFFGTAEILESFFLTVMSYDRYVAICNPFHYFSIMTNATSVTLTIICWLLGFSIVFIDTATTAKLNFCGLNIIDHLFCDFVPLLDISCSDAFAVQLEIYIMGIPSLIIPMIIIVMSYTYIVLAVLRIPSSTGRQKAFSTCSSHLIVVSIFYGTIFSVYILPTKGQTLTMNKILSLLYTVFTPLANPIIYSLRNNDIRKAAQEVLNNSVIW